MKDLKKALLYSLKPFELGYCGPQSVCGNRNVLKEYLLGKSYQESLITGLLDEFIGSACYYSLIARENNIKSRYDRRVISAYWIGNELLEKVKLAELKMMILTDFVGENLLTEGKAQKIVENISFGVVPHHSFHVFYIGSITGRVKITAAEKDKCKVSWGEVTEVIGQRAEVLTRKLFGSGEKIKVDWDARMVPHLKKGDLVSFHWGRISEKLTRKEFDNLVKYTIINYNLLK